MVTVAPPPTFHSGNAAMATHLRPPSADSLCPWDPCATEALPWGAAPPHTAASVADGEGVPQYVGKMCDPPPPPRPLPH